MYFPEKSQPELLPYELIYLDNWLEGISWNAAYSTHENFTGDIVCGYRANRIVLTYPLLDALREAKVHAEAISLRLLIWDAVRPQRAVDHFVRWCHAPEDGRTKAAYYPNVSRTELLKGGYIAERSGHTRGCAVDLTLIDECGELDMGGRFDLMDIRSHHGAQGLSPEQENNRRILRTIMEQSGFTAYENEWWHYSLKPEPFPNRYFDFDISPSSATTAES